MHITVTKLSPEKDATYEFVYRDDNEAQDLLSDLSARQAQRVLHILDQSMSLDDAVSEGVETFIDRWEYARLEIQR